MLHPLPQHARTAHKGETSLYRTEKHTVFHQNDQSGQQQLFTLTTHTKHANAVCDQNVDLGVKKVLTSKVVVEKKMLYKLLF